MKFGPYAPDKAKSGNDGILTVCEGVYPLEDGYRPVGQFAAITTALPSAPKGGATFTSQEGISTIVAGSNSALYKVFSGGWQLLADGYSLLGDARWRFAQFGGIAIATNGTDPLQKIDLSALTVANLEGNPPTFEALGVVKDFLVGTVRDGNVMMLGWSGINDAEWWTVAQRQSDYQIVPDGGRINGILSGEYGILLQRDCLRRMDYTGGNTIFQFNVVSTNVGCVTVHSVAQWGQLGFFLSDEGFMMWDGQQPIPIGREFVDREFASQYGVADWGAMSTTVDPVNAVVMWSMGDKIWMYSWLFKRWAIIPVAAPIVFSGVTKAVSIDEDYLPDMPDDADIDAAGLPSLDDPIFKGGDPTTYAFSATYTLGSFSGIPMAASFAGNEIEMFRGRRSCLRFARPDCDAISGLTVGFAARQRLGDSPTATSFNAITASGDMPVRVSARYLRPSLAIAAGTSWSYAKGVDFMGEPGAGR